MSRQSFHPDEENQLRLLAGKGNPQPTSDKTDQTGASNPYIRLVSQTKDEYIYSDSEGNTTLNLATLQRMVLFRLQAKIIEETGQLASSTWDENNHPLDKLKTHLTEYAQVVRDWELMSKYQAEAGENTLQDPFSVSGKWELTSKAMGDAKLAATGKYGTETLATLVGTFYQRHKMNKEKVWRAFFCRLGMAIFGGITVVGPMLLMVLHNDRATDLATTSVAVVLFAVVVARFSNAAPEAIVSAVAAYGAVLVVFVGTLNEKR